LKFACFKRTREISIAFRDATRRKLMQDPKSDLDGAILSKLCDLYSCNFQQQTEFFINTETIPHYLIYIQAPLTSKTIMENIFFFFFYIPISFPLLSKYNLGQKY